MTLPLRERRRQMLRDEITEAARLLMTKKGYALMSMDEVAAQVGISKPTLYSYFATKEELVVTVAIHEICQVRAIIEEGEGKQSPLQRLRRLLFAVLSRQIDEATMDIRPMKPELFDLLCNHDEACKLLDFIDESVVSLVHAAVAEGEIDPALDPPTVVRAFYALVHTFNIGNFSRGGDADPACMAHTLATIFERGVRPPSLPEEHTT